MFISNKIIKFIIHSLLVIFLLSYILIMHYDFLFRDRTYIKDVSISSIVNNNKSYSVYLLSYAGGKEIHFRNQNSLTLTALNKGVDFFMHYSPKQLDQQFTEKNKKILAQERGAGYWIWKPYIILKTMEKANEGDVILYIDSGVIFDSKQTNGINSLLNKIDSENKDIFLFKNKYLIRSHVKKDLMVYLDMDSEEYLKRNQILAAFMVFKNTEKSRKFVREWLELCEREDLVTDIPSKLPEYTDFKDHRHDQAILSLMSFKYENDVYVFPTGGFTEWFAHHRRREDLKNRTLFLPWNPIL